MTRGTLAVVVAAVSVALWPPSGSALDLARPSLSKHAQALGVTGTPTFFLGLTDPKSSQIKGTRLVGAQPYQVFKDAIERLLTSRK